MTVITNLVLHERANGVVLNNRFYPYKIAYLSTDGETITVKKNTRLFVKSIGLSCSIAGIQAALTMNISGTLSGDTCRLCYEGFPAMTQAADFATKSLDIQLGILLD